MSSLGARMFGLVLTVAALAAAPVSYANPVVSFGVQGGQPATETIGGVVVAPDDMVDVADSSILFGGLPPAEDIDAFHLKTDGNILFSTTTSVTLGGVVYSSGDIVEYDGIGFSVFFDGGNFGTTENVDAVSMLPSGEVLISTQTSASLFGLDFADGDVVAVDVVSETAEIYMGLDEAAIFTGSNANIDALHYDPLTGNVVISVVTDGVGTIGGLAINGTGSSSDLIELDLSSGVSGSLLLDGAGLFDGATRQLDAAYLHPQCDDGVDNDGDGATDFPADIGCRILTSTLENPECSDGLDNEGVPDGRIDFDGGAWALGVAATLPDSNCEGKAWRNSELKGKKSCGLGGGGLAGMAALLGWLRSRRRSEARRT